MKDRKNMRLAEGPAAGAASEFREEKIPQAANEKYNQHNRDIMG